MLHYILADISGPFYDPKKPFRNWSSMPFTQLDQAGSPYVDTAQLAWGISRAIAQLQELKTQGYTGIVIDNLAHLVCFDGTPAAYPKHSPYRQRALAYREAFGRLFQAAAEADMAVFVTSDMQWSTPPLRRWLGPLRSSNPRLAQANQWALDELFRLFPMLEGVVIRVGETGGAHDHDGYTGHLIYRTPAELRHLLAALLPVCEEHGRLLVARTWSVGIGKLGDLLWSPERYQAVFGRFHSKALVVSVKHGPADFFRLLPPNPTLGQPGPPQIIEMQNRREYELFGMVPSNVASLHQPILQAAARNSQIIGIWAWNSTGGWGGGTSALGEQGWSFWTRLSSALTAALAHDPYLETSAFVRGWCERELGGEFGEAVAALYESSARCIVGGWYPGGQQLGQRQAGALYLPPLLWVWWLRPTAAPLIWALIAAGIPSLDQTLAEGALAAGIAEGHARHIAALAPAGDTQAQALAASASYMADVLALAHAIRNVMLPAASAALANEQQAWLALLPHAAELRQKLAAHRSTWQGRSDFPALELDEIDTYLANMQARPTRFWKLAWLAATVVRYSTAGGVRRRMYAAGGAALALGGAWLSRSRSRPHALAALAALVALPFVSRQMLGRSLPWLSRRLYLLPSIFFETGPSIQEW